MGRARLSKTDVKALNERISRYGLELGKKDAVERVESDAGAFYVVNGMPWFHADPLIPHLKLLQERDALPKVTVDMGAVRFVTNGADIMRPGITAIDDGIRQGDLVAVVEERHGKALAVGEALQDAEAMRAATEGKCVKTIHFVGDKAWDA